jgi:methyl-accepting chemotaxis protein
MADLAGIVADVKYLSSGYAALVKQGTLEVIAFAGRTGDLYDVNSQTFKTVTEIEPGVSGYVRELASPRGGVFEFEKPGTHEAWYVAHVPFLSTTNHKTGKTSNALVAMVFVKKSEALSTIPPMESTISRSTAITVVVVVVGSFVTGITIMAALLVMVRALVVTLEMMKDVSRQIVAMQSEEFRTYGSILQSIPEAITYDELGMLHSHFRSMVDKLHRTQASGDKHAF